MRELPRRNFPWITPANELPRQDFPWIIAANELPRQDYPWIIAANYWTHDVNSWKNQPQEYREGGKSCLYDVDFRLFTMNF
jgi:hypothetical protein